MKRVNLSDGSGWFDADVAQMWPELREFNGKEYVAVATGSTTDHQALYRTESGQWVLHAWSQLAGSPDKVETIPTEEAYTWLRQNEHWDAVPPENLDATEL